LFIIGVVGDGKKSRVRLANIEVYLWEASTVDSELLRPVRGRGFNEEDWLYVRVVLALRYLSCEVCLVAKNSVMKLSPDGGAIDRFFPT
jgi:hypothetical protein